MNPLSARRWPLLAVHQDPDSIEARVAFHLRRHGCFTTALSETGVVADRNHGADLINARAAVNPADAARLEVALDLAQGELTRALTDVEIEEWAFHRISARHRAEVWKRAKRLWNSHGVTMRTAAAVMGYSPSFVSRALGEKKKPVLTHPRAALLTAWLEVPEGPAILIQGLEPDPR